MRRKHLIPLWRRLLIAALHQKLETPVADVVDLRRHPCQYCTLDDRCCEACPAGAIEWGDAIEGE